ncbi:hypothetical protein XM69_u0055 [Vibrio parahaemolyticus]|nr:hypothetical protein XM69_u0055 [Vibrio parahaemolyticus]
MTKTHSSDKAEKQRATAIKLTPTLEIQFVSSALPIHVDTRTLL